MDANMTTCLMRLIFISHSMRHFAQVDNILDQTHIIYIYIPLLYVERHSKIRLSNPSIGDHSNTVLLFLGSCYNYASM